MIKPGRPKKARPFSRPRPRPCQSCYRPLADDDGDYCQVCVDLGYAITHKSMLARWAES